MGGGSLIFDKQNTSPIYLRICFWYMFRILGFLNNRDENKNNNTGSISSHFYL